MQGTYTGTQASQINEYVEGFTLYILTACVCTCVCTLHMKVVAFTQTHEYMEGELAGGLMKGPIHFLCFTLRITLATPTIYRIALHCLDPKQYMRSSSH